MLNEVTSLSSVERGNSSQNCGRRGVFVEFRKRSREDRISDGGYFDPSGYIRHPKISANLENLLAFSGFSE
jgi:hypothetical protein